MRRLDSGAPLRAAMREAGLNIPLLAEAAGLSPALVGFAVGAGKSAREECSDRAAEAMAQALDKPLESLFVTEASSLVATESTSTPRMQIMTRSSTPLPERLMTQSELCGFLAKSSSWVDREIKKDPHWPGLIYVGRSRRFDPHAVLEHLGGQRTAAARAA